MRDHIYLKQYLYLNKINQNAHKTIRRRLKQTLSIISTIFKENKSSQLDDITILKNIRNDLLKTKLFKINKNKAKKKLSIDNCK